MHTSYLAFVPVLFVVLVGCQTYSPPQSEAQLSWSLVSGSPDTNVQDGCIADYNPETDYFPDKSTLTYAQHFTVSYHRNYKVVKARVQHQALDIAADSSVVADSFSDLVVLVQCGTPAPPLEGSLAGAHVIEIPVRRTAINYDEDAIRLREVGMLDRIVALGGGGIYEPTLRQRWEEGTVVGIGYSFHGEPKMEVMLSLRPDLTFMTIAGLDNAKGMHRVRQLGLPVAPVFSWAEQHYLARAEWIKYNALFFNAEAAANAVFSDVASRSLALSAMARAAPEKPEALWAMFGRRGNWVVHQNDMEATLLRDAGAINLLADTLGAGSSIDAIGIREGVTMSGEIVLERAKDADYWITWNLSDENGPSLTYMNQFKAYRESHVYNTHKRSNFETDAFDWYETVPVRPDWLLEDLVSLFHPELVPGHTPRFLQPIRYTKKTL